ncbi:Serine/threonine protein kinase PrkC, regulator of stationary phase [Fimbriiglobus ruber]|uniref:non-specific serine/threonine protein kinase n=1 Tax=Fimbriiglobus ruber TaxID=1908690 RepID=A0A225DG72_9BACT|nr:Serine/threonine protein kinase PrkC, regulator of stationary phase [Fimbriiglobus ruber]
MLGQYEVLGEIARGGMGVVYKARQRGLDRVVALKMVLGTDLGQPANVRRFVQEARAAAALDHPNVVPIYDSGELDGRVFFTMAYVDGPDLKAHIGAHGVPSLANALLLFAQIASGVGHAHKHGIIHRDLKPGNVLIDKDGRPRITDFGLAKRGTGDSQLTGTGQIMGTPAYMPPEQARGAKDIGPAADVYSLGAVLYFLLTGRPPFEGETITDLLIKVVSESPIPPRTSHPDIPPEVEAVCMRCLAKDPTGRYTDANALFVGLTELTDRYVPRSAPRLVSLSDMVNAKPVPAGGESGNISAEKNTVTISPPNTPAPRRKVTALSGVAATLVVAGVLVAVARPWSNFTRPGIPTRPSLAAEEAHRSPPPPADTGPVNTVAWPSPVKSDFSLTVELLAPTVKRDNVLLLANKSPLEIRLRAEVDCTAAVWSIQPDGVIVQLFPNTYDQNGRLKAGEARTVPGNAKYAIETTPTIGSGAEQIRVVATTDEMPPLPSGQRSGEYALFNTDDGRRQVVALRGLVVKPTRNKDQSVPKIAEVELKYRVISR